MRVKLTKLSFLKYKKYGTDLAIYVRAAGLAPGSAKIPEALIKNRF
jgi:hypothetical protein